MEKPKISVTVITLNEEKELPQCLASVRNIADEVIVVDSGSTDATLTIANNFGAKIYFRKFDNYANQKNFAAEKASGEWILSLDADEKVSAKLSDEIISKLHNTNSKYVAYSIPRKNFIFGKFIRFTRWQPELDRHIWLWKKGRGHWVGDVHEEVVVNEAMDHLKNAKIHHQYDNVSEFLQMMNRYSEIDADERVKNGVKFSFLKMLLDAKYNFIVRYFYRLGFLDGWRGFVLSYLMAIYQLEVWIKVWEKYV